MPIERIKMKNQKQDYNFEGYAVTEQAKREALNNYIEDRAVNKITCFWVLSLIIVFAYPIACAIAYYSSTTDSNFFTLTLDAVAIFEDYMYRFGAIPNIIILLIRIAAIIVHHALAITGRIKYPKNKKMNTVFSVDIVVFGVTLGVFIVVTVSFGIICYVCETCG